MAKRGARWLAQQAGEIRYIPENPCPKCGTFLRVTSGGKCCECARKWCYDRYHNDHEWREKQKEKAKKNPELRNKKMRDWRNSLPPEKREEVRRKIRDHSRKIRKERPKERLFYSAKHRADKILRTPKWADIDAMKTIYKNCPSDKHVDHIIPLRAKLLSGLHVEYNLQYLDAFENLSKQNKYEPRFFERHEIEQAQSAMGFLNVQDFYSHARTGSGCMG